MNAYLMRSTLSNISAAVLIEWAVSLIFALMDAQKESALGKFFNSLSFISCNLPFRAVGIFISGDDLVLSV